MKAEKDTAGRAYCGWGLSPRASESPLLGCTPCSLPSSPSFTLSAHGSQNNTCLAPTQSPGIWSGLLCSSLPKAPGVPETQEINAQDTQRGWRLKDEAKFKGRERRRSWMWSREEVIRALRKEGDPRVNGWWREWISWQVREKRRGRK